MPTTRIVGDITGIEAVDFTSTKATLSGACQDKDHMDLTQIYPDLNFAT